MKMFIVQVAEWVKGEARLTHFVLGVYSTHDKATEACTTHANEFAEGGKAYLMWNATFNKARCSNASYFLYARTVDADCLEKPDAK